MKPFILDDVALTQVSPSSLEALALELGWIVDLKGKHVVVYVGHGLPEITVPSTNRLTEYPIFVEKLVKTFARISRRDPGAVYRDLIDSDHDIIRVRAISAEADGSIALEAGATLVSQTRALIAAAARSAYDPQIAYRGRPVAQAAQYMHAARLGQTEQGSFVCVVRSPTVPRTLLHGEENTPFERLVSHRLMAGLAAARAAIHTAEPLKALRGAVGEGVSANLCESVGKLIADVGEIDVSTAWARARPIPDAPQLVTFGEGEGADLREAAKQLTNRNIRENQTIYGWVKKLEKDQREDLGGHIVVNAKIDNKIAPVSAHLDTAQYETAQIAHRFGAFAVLQGDLEPDLGGKWRLSHAKLVDIVRPEDESDAE